VEATIDCKVFNSIMHKPCVSGNSSKRMKTFKSLRKVIFQSI